MSALGVPQEWRKDAPSVVSGGRAARRPGILLVGPGSQREGGRRGRSRPRGAPQEHAGGVEELVLRTRKAVPQTLETLHRGVHSQSGETEVNGVEPGGARALPCRLPVRAGRQLLVSPRQRRVEAFPKLEAPSVLGTPGGQGGGRRGGDAEIAQFALRGRPGPGGDAAEGLPVLGGGPGRRARIPLGETVLRPGGLGLRKGPEEGPAPGVSPGLLGPPPTRVLGPAEVPHIHEEGILGPLLLRRAERREALEAFRRQGPWIPGEWAGGDPLHFSGRSQAAGGSRGGRTPGPEAEASPSGTQPTPDRRPSKNLPPGPEGQGLAHDALGHGARDGGLVPLPSLPLLVLEVAKATQNAVPALLVRLVHEYAGLAEAQDVGKGPQREGNLRRTVPGPGVPSAAQVLPNHLVLKEQALEDVTRPGDVKVLQQDAQDRRSARDVGQVQSARVLGGINDIPDCKLRSVPPQEEVETRQRKSPHEKLGTQRGLGVPHLADLRGLRPPQRLGVFPGSRRKPFGKICPHGRVDQPQDVLYNLQLQLVPVGVAYAGPE
ncbi:hypothetical protein HWI79_2731 [Cryptosporidium felis]|nr:hypothetical protein HWI79_2731 [Cryptosporidium felis]